VKLRFDQFTLDTDTHQLLRGDQPIHLSPKAFDLLTALVHNRPKVMTKAVLQELLWPATFVSEANLPTLISEVRAALQDEPDRPRFIRTVHRVGYAFSETATEIRGVSAPEPNPVTRYWLVHGSRKFVLAEGTNIIGRDPDSTVWLDSASVSRRHSSIEIDRGRVMLNDLGSKNGTFHSERRVESAPLHDGDRIRVGSIRLRFRIWSAEGPTETQSVASKRAAVARRRPHGPGK